MRTNLFSKRPEPLPAGTQDAWVHSKRKRSHRKDGASLDAPPPTLHSTLDSYEVEEIDVSEMVKLLADSHYPYR